MHAIFLLAEVNKNICTNDNAWTIVLWEATIIHECWIGYIDTQYIATCKQKYQSCMLMQLSPGNYAYSNYIKPSNTYKIILKSCNVRAIDSLVSFRIVKENIPHL